jgi:hypothetical protein
MAKQTATPARKTPTRTTTVRRTEGVTRKVRADESKIQWGIPLGKKNLMLMAGAVGIIIVGYLLMATAISDDPANNQGIWNNAYAVTWAPILLVIGYCIIAPIAIMLRSKGDEVDNSGESVS